MTLPPSVWSKVCNKLIELSIIPEERVYKYDVTAADTETILEIVTDGDRYKLNLTISTVSKSNEHIPNENLVIFIESENIQINIKRYTIEGYKSCTFKDINGDSDSDATNLKSVLIALACSHARSIETQKIVSDDNRYSLVRDDYKKILSILYEVIEKKGGEEVDGILFSRSVENLYYASGAVLRPKNSNIFVESYILQNRLFSKLSDRGSVLYKIVNVMPNRYIPLVYDVLLCIFFFSTPITRQHYFHELLDFYYNALTEKLHQLGLNIANILPFKEYHKLIYRFSPYVKTEVALFSCWQHLKPLKILEDGSFVSNVWNLFDSDERHLKCIWKWILEIYNIVLYSNMSKEDCYKIVKNIIGTSDYEFLNWELIPVEERTGYLGDYFKLTINIKLNVEVKSFKLFVKCFPTTNKTAQEVAAAGFKKEEFFYLTFISQVNNLGLKEITNFLPKCYFSRIHDVIVLEDMSLLNYRSLRPGEPFSHEIALLVTKQLAKLHACSLLYEEIMTEKLGEPFRLDEKFDKFVEEAFLDLVENQPRRIVTCGILGSLKYLLDTFPEIPKKFTMEEFKEKVKKLYDNMVPSKLKSTKYRNVITQGDPWGNNFLFKRDVNDKPTECCIIDYQLIRYCPPSHELIFFIYLNTDKEIRKECMSTIIKQYYTELSQILKKYNFDLSKIYTYETFLESCDFVKPDAIALASLYLQLVVYPPEKMDNLMLDKEKADYVISVDRKELLDEVHHDNYYRQRLKEIVEELYEVCESS